MNNFHISFLIKIYNPKYSEIFSMESLRYEFQILWIHFENRYGLLC